MEPDSAVFCPLSVPRQLCTGAASYRRWASRLRLTSPPCIHARGPASRSVRPPLPLFSFARRPQLRPQPCGMCSFLPPRRVTVTYLQQKRQARAPLPPGRSARPRRACGADVAARPFLTSRLPLRTPPTLHTRIAHVKAPAARLQTCTPLFAPRSVQSESQTLAVGALRAHRGRLQPHEPRRRTRVAYAESLIIREPSVDRTPPAALAPSR